MCDDCNRILKEFDKNFPSEMESALIELKPLLNTLDHVMVREFGLDTIAYNSETDERLELHELPDKDRKEFEQTMHTLKQVMSLGFLGGFLAIKDSTTPYNAKALVNQLHRSIEDGVRFRLAMQCEAPSDEPEEEDEMPSQMVH